jgi:transcriptional regulator with XRE-family HTH domain
VLPDTVTTGNTHRVTSADREEAQMSLPDFASLVRSLLTDRKMSANALAQEIPVDAGHLSRVLNGKRRPSLDLARGCDRVFGTGELLADAVRGSARSTEEARGQAEVEVADGLAARRRVLLGGIAIVAGAAGLFDVRPAAARRRLGRADVARVEAVTALYRSVDYEHGGGVLVRDVGRFAEAASALLEQSYPVALAPSLLAAVAAARQLAGWTAFDTGRHADAQRHFLSAERAALAAGDKLLTARVRYCQARQFQHLRHNRDALDTLRLARDHLGAAATPAVNAMLHGAQAASQAAIGDNSGAVTSLGEASGDFERIRDEGEPSWMGFYDQGELLAQYGRVYRDLARDDPRYGGEAVTWVRQAIAGFGPTNVRSTVLNEVGLCSALFLADEPEEALAVGQRVLDQAGQVSSQRVQDRIVNLRRDLGRHAGLPEVADFAHRLPATGTASA